VKECSKALGESMAVEAVVTVTCVTAGSSSVCGLAVIIHAKGNTDLPHTPSCSVGAHCYLITLI
jgi:hypothetical protein